MKTSRQRIRNPLPSRAKQRGVGEELFLLFISVVGLVVLLVFVVCVWVGKGPKGKFIGFLVACILTSPVLWPVAKSFYEGEKTRKLQAKVEAICRTELAQTPGPFPVNGFLDETHGLSPSDIQYFLTEGRFAFIEVRLNSSGLLAAQEPSPWPATATKGIGHIALGRAGDESCYVPPGIKPEDFFTNNSPIKPGSCLRVTYEDSPSSKYAVEMEPVKNSNLSRWVLRDLSNNNVIAGFTDAWNAMYPNQRPLMTPNGHDSCRKNGVSGLTTLMQRIKPSPDAAAISANWLISSELLEIRGVPPTIMALSDLRNQGKLPVIQTTDEPYSGTRESLFKRASWPDSYAMAEKHGAWMYGNTLINIHANKLYPIKYNGIYGKWGTTGEQLILVSSNQLGSEVAIFGVGFDGNLIWGGQIASLHPWTTDANMTFSPEVFELNNSQLLIHGMYGHSVGEENYKPWTVKVPLAQLIRLSATKKQ